MFVSSPYIVAFEATGSADAESDLGPAGAAAALGAGDAASTGAAALAFAAFASLSRFSLMMGFSRIKGRKVRPPMYG